MQATPDKPAVEASVGSPQAGARLQLLWVWRCAQTAQLNATCMAWNKAGALSMRPSTGCSASDRPLPLQCCGHSLTLLALGHKVAIHGLVLQVRKDVLAVGYGHFNFGPQQPGLVAFWSLKNPGHPLWTFPTSSGVTAVDFATQSPNMLAVGPL